MFVRQKIWKKSTSVQIVKWIRIWGKVKQKVLKYIWSRKNEDKKWIEDLFKAALYIKHELEKQWQTELIPLEETDIKIIEKDNKEKNKCIIYGLNNTILWKPKRRLI